MNMIIYNVVLFIRTLFSRAERESLKNNGSLYAQKMVIVFMPSVFECAEQRGDR